MVLDVGVRVSGVDFDHPDIFDLMGEKHPHLMVSGHQPCVVSFAVDEDRPVDHAVEIVRALQVDLPALVVDGVDRNLVGVSDIAQRVGISREGVRKWTQHGDFPTAQGYLQSASMPVWAWGDVIEWLLAERSIDMEERLPSMKVLTQIENCLMKNPDNTTVEWHQLQNVFAGETKTATFQVRRPSSTNRAFNRTTTGVRAQSAVSFRSDAVRANAGKQLTGSGRR